MEQPVIDFDPTTQVITVDGCKFSRKFFHYFTTAFPGIRLKIIARKDGVISMRQEYGFPIAVQIDRITIGHGQSDLGFTVILRNEAETLGLKEGDLMEVFIQRPMPDSV